MYSKLLILLIPLLGLFKPYQAGKILWGSQELTWDHFRATPDYTWPSAAATMSIVHLSISYSDSKTMHVKVEALFDPSKSWVKEKRTTLLVHERGHFDIAEVFARKLRKTLSLNTYKEEEAEKEVFKLYNNYNLEMDMYQNRYDLETNYSRNAASQDAWTRQIQSQLIGLNGFTKTTLVIKLQ